MRLHELRRFLNGSSGKTMYDEDTLREMKEMMDVLTTIVDPKTEWRAVLENRKAVEKRIENGFGYHGEQTEYLINELDNQFQKIENIHSEVNGHRHVVYSLSSSPRSTVSITSDTEESEDDDDDDETYDPDEEEDEDKRNNATYDHTYAAETNWEDFSGVTESIRGLNRKTNWVTAVSVCALSVAMYVGCLTYLREC